MLLVLGTVQSVCFAASKMGLPEEELITQKQVRDRQTQNEPFLLLDARHSHHSYEGAHVAGALLPRSADFYKEEDRFKNGEISQSPDPDKALADFMGQYDKTKRIVTYCDDGCQASASLLIKIKKLGF